MLGYALNPSAPRRVSPNGPQAPVTTHAFQTVALIGKPDDPAATATVARLATLLAHRGVTVRLETRTAAALGPTRPEAGTDLAALGAVADLALVVGGDGTLIGVARTLCAHKVPLMGINLGSLGFLTETHPAHLEGSIAALLAGNYRREQRMMLQVRVERAGQIPQEACAFNDAVVHRGPSARMVTLATYVDARFVLAQAADGLIVASPTGSTAYALSAGGPIVHPRLPAFALVPICPHTLTNRPIVLPATSRIEVVLTQAPGAAQLTLDGQVPFALAEGDRVHVERAPHDVDLLCDPQWDYFAVLREKLRWGERP